VRVQRSLAAVVGAVVDGGPAAAVSASDAAWLARACSNTDDSGALEHGATAALADAWAAITTVCTTGDAHTTATRLLSANVLAGAAAVTLKRARSDDVDSTRLSLHCLHAVASVCGAAAASAETALDATDSGAGKDEREVGVSVIVTPPEMLRVSAALCGDIADAVVGVMQLHALDCGDSESADVAESNAQIARQGCVALSRLLQLDQGQTDVIGAAGGVQAVLSVMQRHIDSADVQESGCCALSQLVDHNVANATAMVFAGGINIVRSAMRRHILSAIVHHEGCKALQRLAPARAGTTETVGAASEQHHGTGTGAGAGSGEQVLGAVSDDPPPNVAATAADVDAAVAEMRCHEDVVTAQECGVRALYRFAASGDAALMAVRDNVDVVLTAMRLHPGSPVVQACGCGVVGRLTTSAGDPDDAEAQTAAACLAAAGAVDAVMSAMLCHPESSIALSRSCCRRCSTTSVRWRCKKTAVGYCFAWVHLRPPPPSVP
jgi:hypothetical protein